MHDDDDILRGTLVHVIEAQQDQAAADRTIAERAEESRTKVDEARLAMAELAGPSVAIIACRLAGLPNDWDGRPVSKEREDTAWELLSRVGIPRLRATAIAASIAASTGAPAPDSPGWVDPEDADDSDQEKELDPATIDGQIEAFIAGARAQRDLGKADGQGGG